MNEIVYVVEKLFCFDPLTNVGVLIVEGTTIVTIGFNEFGVTSIV